MGKFTQMFLKAVGLGLGLGLCLGGFAAILHRSLHPESTFIPYFLLVGALFGILGGWCLALQMVLRMLVGQFFWNLAGLVPLTTSVVSPEWAEAMRDVFERLLLSSRGVMRWVIGRFVIPGFGRYTALNKSLEEVRRKSAGKSLSAQEMAFAALSVFVEPLWVLFLVAYGVLLLCAAVFWVLPFIR